MQKRKLVFLIGDIFIVAISFLVMAWIKPATKSVILPNYFIAFAIFIAIWLLISWTSGKYAYEKRIGYINSIKPLLLSNAIILSVITVLMVLIHFHNYSRLVVFGTYSLSFILELIATYLYLYNYKITLDADILDKRIESLNKNEALNGVNEIEELVVPKPEFKLFPDEYPYASVNKKLIIQESGEKVFNYINRFVDLEKFDYAIFSTSTRFNIEKQPDHYFKTIINLKRINDILRINKFLETINSKLPKNGYFIGCVETKNLRKKRIFAKLPPVISHIYYFFDFIFKRVFPKVFILKKIYFFFNKGQNRVVSKQETYGRLYSCGFEHVHDSVIDGNLYFVFRKIKDPAFDFNPSYGPMFKMKRIGKNGKTIYVYKMRTMYPYSEYLQEYVYERNNLDEGGKFKRDFRVTTAGRIMRKFWIDELPMFLNLFKGDLKLVGVRPLSRHYLSLYTDELREKRMKTKPGLVPPFYVDMPKTLEEIMASETKYLEAYGKHPFLTDFKYFFAAFTNIVFRKARSK